MAYSHTIRAAEHLGQRDEVRERIRGAVASERLVIRVLARELGLGAK